MKKIVVESPLSGDFVRNVRYTRLCCLDAIRRGEAPYAGHLLMTQFLDDEVPEHRKVGMEAGFAWGACAELCAVYIDLGVSSGMRAGIEKAVARGIPVEERNLPVDLMAKLDREDPRATKGVT